MRCTHTPERAPSHPRTLEKGTFIASQNQPQPALFFFTVLPFLDLFLFLFLYPSRFPFLVPKRVLCVSLQPPSIPNVVDE